MPAVWGIVGVLALLGNAIYRLTPYAVELAHIPLTTVELVTLIGWIAFNTYAEGYRAFHLMFSPRVVARARTLDAQAPLLHKLAAPLYCMGLFHATRKRLIIAWTVTAGIVGIVIVVRALSQPWRGIIDAGVVIGLAIGIVSILYHAARAITGHAPPVSPDLPPESAHADPRGSSEST